MKFLFGIMHPRRLPFFMRSMNAIDYVDILLAKNMELIMAQNMIRTYFLERDYDYLILTSDDVEIPIDAPHEIMFDVEDKRYEIITGWSKIKPDIEDCNITYKANLQIEEQIDKPFYHHMYNFITTDQIKEHIRKKEYVIPVWFIGWSVTAMSRKSVLDWTPRGWYFSPSEPYHLVFNGMEGRWCSSDLWYSYNMWKKGYQAYCDLTVYVPHNPPRPQPLLVGIEPPRLEFRPADKRVN